MNDLTDLARQALDVSIVTNLDVTPHLDVVVVADQVGSLSMQRLLPGMSSVTVSIELTVNDYEKGRLLFPETFDRLDRMIAETGKRR